MRAYLDLEGTIIDVFDSGHLMNVDKIRAILKGYGVKEVGIFSFAILHDADRQDFYARLAPSIEEALGVKIIVAPTIHDMMRNDFNISGTYWDIKNGVEMSEWMSLRGKAESFRMWALQQGKQGDNFVLIDDVVPNMTIVYEDIELTMKFINIDKVRP